MAAGPYGLAVFLCPQIPTCPTTLLLFRNPVPVKEKPSASVRQNGTFDNPSELSKNSPLRQFGTRSLRTSPSNFWYPGFELLVPRVRQIGTQGSTNWYFQRVSKMPGKPYFMRVSGVPPKTGKYGTYCGYCKHKRRPPFKTGAPSYDVPILP